MPSKPLRTLRILALILVAMVFAAAAPTAAACDYDFTFSHTSSGDVQIDVDVSCPGPITSTSLSGSPGHVSTLVYDSHASIVVPAKKGKGTWQYCGSALSTYYQGNGIYVLDFGSYQCATL